MKIVELNKSKKKTHSLTICMTHFENHSNSNIQSRQNEHTCRHSYIETKHYIELNRLTIDRKICHANEKLVLEKNDIRALSIISEVII